MELKCKPVESGIQFILENSPIGLFTLSKPEALTLERAEQIKQMVIQEIDRMTTLPKEQKNKAQGRQPTVFYV